MTRKYQNIRNSSVKYNLVVRPVIRKNNGLNVHLTNVLDTDLYIISLINVQNHLNITRSKKIKSVSINGVIVNHKNNLKTVIMIIIKRYMHLWHK